MAKIEGCDNHPSIVTAEDRHIMKHRLPLRPLHRPLHRPLLRRLLRPGIVVTALAVCFLAASVVSGRRLQAGTVGPSSSQNRLAEVDRLITAFETSETQTPTSSGLNFLGDLLLRRSRISGEASSLVRADEVSLKALEIAPRNIDAQLLRAKVLYNNHEFAAAATIAQLAVDAAPKSPETLTAFFDATLELGDVESATDILRKVEVLAPDAPAVLVRQARLAFLTGRVDNATYLAEQARRRAPQSGVIGSDLAFFSSFAGQLAFDRGEVRDSAKLYEESLRSAPGDRGAMFGLARALAAQGKTERAILLLEDLVIQFPDPVALALLGDLQTIRGENEQATQTYELVEATASLAKSNHQIFDRQITMFFADHQRKPAEAVQMAHAELLVRHDVYAYDTLAWAAFRSGDLVTAKRASDKALTFGTQDAAIFAHAGLIAAATGDNRTAHSLLSRSVRVNPYFSPIVAPLVKAELQRISSKEVSK